MKQSESIATLAKALVQAQGNMGDVRKTATNPHFRSKYADLAAVVDAIVPALNKAGIAVVQGASANDAGNVVAVETMLLHESGEYLSSELRIALPKNDAQGAGSAITYGRRYLLLAMAGVAPEDDDGNAASVTPKAQRPVSVPSPARNAAPIARPNSRANTKEWVPAISALASKLPPEEVQRAYADNGVASVEDIDTRELARTIYAVLHSLADSLGVVA